MIKLVSFIVFIAAFVWTWFLFNSHSKINLATHAGIQSKFMMLIEESVKAGKPNSSNFEITSISTEKIDDNQVSAHFSYKYDDQLQNEEKVSQTMKGEALLYRSLSENQRDDKWIIKSVKTDNQNLEFQNGLIVNPNTDAESTTGDKPTEPPPVEKKTQ